MATKVGFQAQPRKDTKVSRCFFSLLRKKWRGSVLIFVSTKAGRHPPPEIRITRVAETA